jgi:tRNA U34 5-carboxymethylaminomethyl modifying GTPase MnmE/TrmE
MLTGNVSYELVSYELQNVLAVLSELTGKTISEAGMDAVFREFCVGK